MKVRPERYRKQANTSIRILTGTAAVGDPGPFA